MADFENYFERQKQRTISRRELPEKLFVPWFVKHFLSLTETESLFLCPHDRVTGTYFEPDAFNPLSYMPFIRGTFYYHHIIYS
jgi:hypothetical protein